MRTASPGKRLAELRFGAAGESGAGEFGELPDLHEDPGHRHQGKRVTFDCRQGPSIAAGPWGRPQVHSAFGLFPGLILTEGLNKL